MFVSVFFIRMFKLGKILLDTGNKSYPPPQIIFNLYENKVT